MLWFALVACASDSIHEPPEAVVSLNLPTLQALTVEERGLWERHLRASLAWEVRRASGCDFGVRLKPQTRGDEVVYESTLNGFTADFGSADGVYQTRVVTGLGCEHGFGRDRGQVTYASAGDEDVALRLEDYMDQPGLNSALLVRSPSGLTLEIYEQGDPLERPFTRSALAEVEAELVAVLAHRQELEQQGVVASMVPEGSTRMGVPSLVVENGMQPGIYRLTGWINPGAWGQVHARVFFEGPAPGQVPPDAAGSPGNELSAERLRPRSTRKTGWGPNPKRLFRYQSEVTVYEGDWGQPYQARFELWHTAPDGSERQLATTIRTIEGWTR